MERMLLTAGVVFRIYQEMRRKEWRKMPDIAWFGLFFLAYLLLTWVILPRLGVPT